MTQVFYLLAGFDDAFMFTDILLFLLFLLSQVSSLFILYSYRMFWVEISVDVFLFIIGVD